MTLTEMGFLLAKIQVGDNREVDEVVIAEWFDVIGDLDFDDARDALRQFRRERPGVYLEPGHLVELVGLEEVLPKQLRDFDLEYVEVTKREALEAAGVTEAEWEAHAGDEQWLREHFPAAFAPKQIEAVE